MKYEVHVTPHDPDVPRFEFELRCEKPGGDWIRYPFSVRAAEADNADAMRELLWMGYRCFRDFIAEQE